MPIKRSKRAPRWGVRLILCLGLATVGLFTAFAQGYHTIGTVSAIAAGLFGASVSSFFGWRAMMSQEGRSPSRPPGE